MYKKVIKCQICNNTLVKFLDLGKQPLCDDLKKKPNKNKFYKLQVTFCNNCITAFQKYNIDKKKLFPENYHYRSANTKDVLDGMSDLVNKISDIKKGLKDLNILDIGCNDGSLLDFFKKKGSKTYGVEPTGAFKEAKKKKHIIFNQFINSKSSRIIKRNIGNIDVITFTNVFAHVENLNDLLKSLQILISSNTLLVIENHYLMEVIKKNQFDTFYHEHPRTYSLSSFIGISRLLNLKIKKYQFVKRYNGNIRVFLCQAKKGEKILLNKKIQTDVKKEKKLAKNIRYMQARIDSWKLKKKKFIVDLNKKYGTLPAKAFPGRASILINLLGLGSNNISKIYEKNGSLKINKYVPGTDIKILKEKYFHIKERKKGIILNLAWHISSEIKNYLQKNLKYRGKIIDIISKKDFI